MTCPICKTSPAADADRSFRPFCSKRCKMVDLGKWFGGEYAIAGPPVLDPNEIGTYGNEVKFGFDMTFDDDDDEGLEPEVDRDPALDPEVGADVANRAAHGDGPSRRDGSGDL